MTETGEPLAYDELHYTELEQTLHVVAALVLELSDRPLEDHHEIAEIMYTAQAQAEVAERQGRFVESIDWWNVLDDMHRYIKTKSPSF